MHRPAGLLQRREDPPRCGRAEGSAVRSDEPRAAARAGVAASAGERLLKAWLPLLLAAAPLAAAADGNGIAVGDRARLHASFETEERYDSLAALGGIGNTNSVALDPADLITHLRPGLRLDAPGADTTFTGSARLDYEFFAGIAAATRSLSFLGAFADADLQLGRGGPVGFAIGEHFSRSDRTSNPALGLGSITDANALDGKLTFRPGGGALEFGLGYLFGLESYELHDVGNVACPAGDLSCDGSRYSSFGSHTQRVAADVRWRFFPKTALLLEGTWAKRTYESGALNINTSPLTATLSLVGLVSEKVRVVLKGGYENTFTASGENYSGPVGQVELGWEPRETTRFALGALRTAEPVSDTYGWYDDLRGYASLSLLLGGRVLLTAGVTGDRLGFANRGRVDFQLGGNALLEYEVNRLLRLGLGCVLTLRDSNSGGPFSYQRAEVFGRVTLTY